MIHSSYPIEIFNHILSHLPTKKGAYERIEHLDLFVRIAFVCKGFRFWVLCSEQGPLKLPEKEVKHYTDSPYATDLRKFICEINLVNVVAPKQAFQFLEKHAYLSNSLKACSPLVTNHENQSLIDVTISKMEHSNVRGLLEFFFSKLSLNELVEFGKGITNKRLYKWENYIQILDLYFAEIKNKTGDDTLAKETVQPLLGKILRSCRLEPALIDWISKKGMKFDIQNLSNVLSYYPISEKAFDFFKMTLDSQPEIVDQTTSCGKKLIHVILKTHNRELQKYYHYLLDKFPAEISAKDREGKSAISYLFKDRLEWLDRNRFNEKVLWEVREECFQTLLSYMQRQRLEFFHKDLRNFREFFVKLKDLFPDQIRFSKWLYSPYGSSQRLFLDELLDISLLSENLNEFFDHIAPNHGNMDKTFELAKMLCSFSKENWGKIRENYSKYPNLKETLLLQSFTEVVAYYYSTVDERISKLTDFFGIEWVHFQDQDGNTLLHHLFSLTPQSMNAYIRPTIAFMMDHGFDPNLKNKAGQTARDLAMENRWRDYIYLIS